MKIEFSLDNWMFGVGRSKSFLNPGKDGKLPFDEAW